jgi:hypothetical protein
MNVTPSLVKSLTSPDRTKIKIEETFSLLYKNTLDSNTLSVLFLNLTGP